MCDRVLERPCGREKALFCCFSCEEAGSRLVVVAEIRTLWQVGRGKIGERLQHSTRHVSPSDSIKLC